MPQRRPSLRDAIAWIADNDEAVEMNPAIVADNLTSHLVADLFGVDRQEIGRRVVAQREREG